MTIEERVLERLPDEVKCKLNCLNYGCDWSEICYHPMAILMNVVIDELSMEQYDIDFYSCVEVINKVTNLGFVSNEYDDDWDERDRKLEDLFYGYC